MRACTALGQAALDLTLDLHPCALAGLLEVAPRIGEHALGAIVVVVHNDALGHVTHPVPSSSNVPQKGNASRAVREGIGEQAGE